MTTCRTTLFLLALSTSAASAAQYGMQPITLPGASSVTATAINNKSVIVGSYGDAAGQHGFVLAGGELTTLPAPPGCPVSQSVACVARPIAINGSGLVLGSYAVDATDYYGFAWQSGAYIPTGTIGFGLQSNWPGVNVLALNSHNNIAYNFTANPGVTFGYAGSLAQSTLIPALSNFGVVTSINDRGDLFGTLYNSVVLILHGVIKRIQPPGAGYSTGGYMNEKRQIGGIFVDAHGSTHGFEYMSGRYTQFDVPAPAKNMIVQGINGSGHIIGTYTDAAHNVQRVFVYTGSAVNAFGHFPGADTVFVTFNDQGEILIADETVSMTTSYRARCGGAGC